ncbi:uncharacterized protein LOC129708963 isoform X2 [Leucoraja erinacea]|uniref:uncharacterized protein LOC129708963 isoform X2 n=1 Tax=Leucoraja erinaceus TaxID=7782 RepID=UPI0024578FB5|nr:uncharacterized protein LOC129708963 isoform X2 [Leucoraja erinacea]
MRKSGPGETLSRLLRRRSSPSLYSPAPSPTERVEDAMVVLSSREGVANAMVDTGTAKVKPRPTVKLAIVMSTFHPFRGSNRICSSRSHSARPGTVREDSQNDDCCRQ